MNRTYLLVKHIHHTRPSDIKSEAPCPRKQETRAERGAWGRGCWWRGQCGGDWRWPPRPCPRPRSTHSWLASPPAQWQTTQGLLDFRLKCRAFWDSRGHPKPGLSHPREWGQLCPQLRKTCHLLSAPSCWSSPRPLPWAPYAAPAGPAPCSSHWSAPASPSWPAPGWWGRWTSPGGWSPPHCHCWPHCWALPGLMSCCLRLSAILT